MCQRDGMAALVGTPLGNKLAPYRNEIARPYELSDGCDAIIREMYVRGQ